MFDEKQVNLIRKIVDEVVQKLPRQNLVQFDIVPRTIKPHHIETVFGNMYAYQAAITVTVAAADTWYEVTTGLSDGGFSDGVDFQNSHELKVNYGGKYFATWALGLSTATANQEIMGALGKNNAVNTASANQSTVANANGKSTAAGNIILDLSAGDLISLFVHNETLATDINIEYATLTLIRIGR